MEIEEIKIDGVVYVPKEGYSCANCDFMGKCNVNKSFLDPNSAPCCVFNGHSLKVKED